MSDPAPARIAFTASGTNEAVWSLVRQIGKTGVFVGDPAGPVLARLIEVRSVYDAEGVRHEATFEVLRAFGRGDFSDVGEWATVMRRRWSEAGAPLTIIEPSGAARDRA